MLSNIVRIIHKNCIDPNFWFVFDHTTQCWLFTQLQRPLALYQGPIVRNVFSKKVAYGKYLLFATLGSYVAWLVAKVFKFQ